MYNFFYYKNVHNLSTVPYWGGFLQLRAGINIKSTVIGLIIINVAIFLFSELMQIPVPNRLITGLAERGNELLAQAFQRYGLLLTIFSLFPALILSLGWVWQVFTYMFLHGSFLHLFFNMYALLLFGRPLEQRWGKRRFLMFYFFTGACAGIVTFLWHLLGWNLFGRLDNLFIPTIGASGAVFGLVLAFGLEFPDARLLLFFLIPLRARYAAFIFGGIELVMILTGSMRGIGHFTHLAGLLFGYIYYVWRIKYRYKKRRGARGRATPKETMTKLKQRLSSRQQARILQQAEEVRIKLDRGSALTPQEEKFLQGLREVYLAHKDEICTPDEFDPKAADCLKCVSFHACLYRYVLDIL
jgi:membrane associated rhomboid family serine protease